MDINIRVKVDSPDIMNALLALAEALPQMKTGVQIKEEPKEVQASKEKEEVKTTTLEEVRAVLAQLAQNGKQKEVKELIKKFGGKKLTDKLEINSKGEFKTTLTNFVLIIGHDPALKGIAYNEHSERIETLSDMPWKRLKVGWSKGDDAGLSCYLEKNYNIHKFEKETIINSLNNLIADVSEILDKVKSNTNDRIELEQLSIAAQINAQGGITWIANVNTGMTNSMVLTFKIKKSK